MAKLGSPVTKKFQIGTAELRIGPLSAAGKLTQAHSVGIIDSAAFNLTTNSVDLNGGFPQILVDTQIVSQTATITAAMREYSQRNMSILSGLGVPATTTTRFSGFATTDSAAQDTAITLQTGEGTNFAAGDFAVIYPEGSPEQVSVCLIASVAVDILTLDAGTPALFAYNGATAPQTVHVYRADHISMGSVTTAQYFAVQLLVQDIANAGAPIGLNVWKAAVSSGLDYNTSATDYGTANLELKLLQPSASEYGVGQPLNPLANVIPSNPFGMFFGGGD